MDSVNSLGLNFDMTVTAITVGKFTIIKKISIKSNGFIHWLKKIQNWPKSCKFCIREGKLFCLGCFEKLHFRYGGTYAYWRGGGDKKRV